MKCQRGGASGKGKEAKKARVRQEGAAWPTGVHANGSLELRPYHCCAGLGLGCFHEKKDIQTTRGRFLILEISCRAITIHQVISSQTVRVFGLC